MSLATATTWGFNWVLSMTWLPLVRAFKPQGAFGYYAAWNIIGFLLVLFFLPETKGRTLEELDRVFEVPTRVHARWGASQVPYFIRRYILQQDVQPPVLLDLSDTPHHPDSFKSESKEHSEGQKV